jgi:hypothetical protein
MTRRKGKCSNYETMFEELLRNCRIPYVAVDEQRRPITSWGTIKNFDFIINSAGGNYILDIKGKLFPQESYDGKSRLYWQNWIHDNDLEGLSFWQDIFGPHFTPLIVFTYQLVYPDSIFQFDDLFTYKEKCYGLVACNFNDYRNNALVRSAKWNVYHVKKEKFLKIIKPLRTFVPEITGQ